MENKLTLFNTATRKLDVVNPICQGKIKLYTCGPTVYNYAHIGNFRAYMAEDILRRTLVFLGYDVEHVMNITDVDDKTIRSALEKKLSLDDFTAVYKKAFFDDIKELGILPAHHYPEATSYIEHMIGMIQTLLEKKVAYTGEDGSIYFSIKAFPEYGKLSHLKLDELEVNASDSNAADEYEKESASDFVLWKKHDPKRDGEIYWESPFGNGRPGWHIECSAMARELLGEQIDIHAGGVDNMFPHHENEIAQSECCFEKQFVRHWFHVEHLLVENRKMSKSAGNFYTLRDLLDKGFTGREIRYLLMQAHYRKQLNFTFEELQAASNSLNRIDNFYDRMESYSSQATEISANVLLIKAKQEFTAALQEDLNISVALSTLFDLMREVNTLADSEKLTESDAKSVIYFIKEIDAVLNVIENRHEETVPQEILDALEKRQKARAEKEWQEADKWRDYIQDQGYIIEDGKDGAKVKKKGNK